MTKYDEETDMSDYLLVGIDDIIEYEDPMEGGVLLTGIVVSMKDDDDPFIQVFEWPYGIEVDPADRFVEVHVENIVGVQVRVGSRDLGAVQ